MRTLHRLVSCGAMLVLIGAAGAGAQMGMGTPQMQGVWNPVVAGGSVYQMEGRGDRKMES